jgi:hypothetical protein
MLAVNIADRNQLDIRITHEGSQVSASSSAGAYATHHDSFAGSDEIVSPQGGCWHNPRCGHRSRGGRRGLFQEPSARRFSVDHDRSPEWERRQHVASRMRKRPDKFNLMARTSRLTSAVRLFFFDFVPVDK